MTIMEKYNEVYMTIIIDSLDVGWYLRSAKEQITIFIQYIKKYDFYLKNNRFRYQK